ncbi:MAG: helix-turn-helix transcriptional regulator [Elusimicrobiales bacterium]|nr:helix-turn-helix transcriptional regulator [Elusimicrobiales bacterium]
MKQSGTTEVLERIGRKIAALRRSALMTQGELARKLRVKKEVVVRIEQGRYRLRMRLLLKIAHVLGRILKVTLIKRKGGV